MAISHISVDDHANRIGSWLALVPARKGPLFVQVSNGTDTVCEVPYGDLGTPRVLAQACQDQANAVGKILNLTLKVVGKGDKTLAVMVVRVRQEEDEAAGAASGDERALIGLLAQHVHASHQLLVTNIAAMAKATASLVSAMERRVSLEMEKSEKNQQLAQTALDVADEANAKAKTAMEQDNSLGKRLEKIGLLVAAKKLDLGPEIMAVLMGAEIPPQLAAQAEAFAAQQAKANGTGHGKPD